MPSPRINHQKLYLADNVDERRDGLVCVYSAVVTFNIPPANNGTPHTCRIKVWYHDGVATTIKPLNCPFADIRYSRYAYLIPDSTTETVLGSDDESGEYDGAWTPNNRY